MKIVLKERLKDLRFTRRVIGKSSCMDISTIFENKEKDFLKDEYITDENFEWDDVYYIQNLGYTRRQSLLDMVFTVVYCDSLSSDLYPIPMIFGEGHNVNANL